MQDKKIKIVFMGTGNFAVPIIEKLNNNYDVRLLVCSPDKPVGRRHVMTPPPTKRFALQNGIQIEQPVRLKDNKAFLQKLKQVNADIIVVVSYGKILPADIINLPEHGCLNIHGSILPKYRGPSPIQTAIKSGDQETGISVILMDTGMDTGDIVVEEVIEIKNEDNYESLSERMSKFSADLINDILPEYIKGNVNLEVQDDDEASYCTKILSEMGKVQWSQSATSIRNTVRAYASLIGVYSTYKDKRLYFEETEISIDSENIDLPLGTVYRSKDNPKDILIKCGKDSLKLIKVKLEGKKVVTVKDFLNGHQDLIGTTLK